MLSVVDARHALIHVSDKTFFSPTTTTDPPPYPHISLSLFLSLSLSISLSISVSHHVLVFLSDRVRRVHRASTSDVTLCIFLVSVFSYPTLSVSLYHHHHHRHRRHTIIIAPPPSSLSVSFLSERGKPIRGETKAREIAPFLDKSSRTSLRTLVKIRTQKYIRFVFSPCIIYHFNSHNEIIENNRSSFFSIAESTNGGASKFNHQY